jgi:hypothetical protein
MNAQLDLQLKLAKETQSPSSLYHKQSFIASRVKPKRTTLNETVITRTRLHFKKLLINSMAEALASANAANLVPLVYVLKSAMTTPL